MGYMTRSRSLKLPAERSGMRRQSALLLFAGSLTWVGASGCIGAVGSGATNTTPCTPGERDCVCSPTQQCEAGLICIADRCIALAGTNTGAPSSGPGTSTQGPSTGNPNPGPGSTPEQGEPSSDPGPTSSQEGGSTASEESPEAQEKAACSDNQRNFRETDIDCGGPICGGCAEQKACRGDVDCASGICIDLICVQCEIDEQCQDENSCTKDRCEANKCIFEPREDGSECDDQDPCTAKDLCDAGSCQGQDTRVLFDNFDDGGDGWRFTHQQQDSKTLWEIGPAQASDCGELNLGHDPAADHTQAGGNGVAGVKIGGCHEGRGDNQWDCIWSKDVEIGFFEERVVFSFWRHLHSPANRRAGGVMNRVVYRINGRGKSHAIETGYSKLVNDEQWEHKSYPVSTRGARSIAFGVCYRKAPRTESFAGWSIDDARIRQEGCEADQ